MKTAPANDASSSSSPYSECFNEGPGSQVQSNLIVPPWSDPADPAPSQTMPAIHHTTAPRRTPLLTERQDKKTVKAIYGDFIIKFDIPLTSGIKELKEVVSETLECELGSFRVQYKKGKGEGEWILMAHDENVKEYLQIVAALGSKEAKLKVDRDPIATKFCGNCECGNCRSLKQTRP